MFPIFGVPVRFHFTFLLIAVFLAFNIFAEEKDSVKSSLYVAGLFGSVLLHELGHALTARRFGIPTVEIVMYPIGGVAKLARSPEPKEEIWITAAGPLVNFLLAAIGIGVLVAQGRAQLSTESLVFRLAAANMGLGLFNLLPAFPMDGGRLLRAILALRMDRARATAFSSRVGKTLALMMGLYAVFTGSYGLVFIAIFVYLGAAQEQMAVQQRSLLQNVPARAAMVTDFQTLPHGSTLKEAADLLLATSQTEFPVVTGETVLGLLSRQALLQGLAAEGPETYVAGVMQREFRRVHPEQDLGQLLVAGQLTNETALVMDEDRLVGLLTPENLAEFLLVRQLDHHR